MFVDKAIITVKAGDGGKGCCSFRREAFIPKGGPDGGDGGNGGNVIIVAAPGEQSLQEFVYNRHFEAEKGVDGKSKDMIGRRGKDMKIKVPPGTIVRNSFTGEILADIDTPDKEVIVARGGKGGRGNSRFATSVNRAPREHEPGEKVEQIELELELKLIADIGFVGFPNAGKSTLLSVLSNANPKIAPYPFTTLHPVIGVMSFPDEKNILLADVPGLLEGAHEDKGLGHTFLRHIERTKMLCYVLDSAGVDGRDPVSDLKVLKSELEHYMKGLSKRVGIVIANKTDLEESKEKVREIKRHLPRGVKFIALSAATDESFEELRTLLRETLERKILEEKYHFSLDPDPDNLQG